MLAGAGFEVHFLLRSDYDHVAKNGLTVRSKANGDLHLANVHAGRSATAMPKCDWLLIGAKRPVMPTLCRQSRSQSSFSRPPPHKAGLRLKDVMNRSIRE